MYYFDHSATTPLLPEVIKLMNTLNENIYGNPSSIYSAGRKSRSIIEEARNQIAQSISSKPEQIIFTSGGTEANNQVLWSIVNESKKHIISNRIEHPAVTKVLKYLKSFGINYELVEVKKDGIVCVDTIIAAIKSNTSNDSPQQRRNRAPKFSDRGIDFAPSVKKGRSSSRLCGECPSKVGSLASEVKPTARKQSCMA